MPRSRGDVVPKKKQHITDAAVELFRRYGMKRVTVTEICEKANVSKMTFYKYFPNKVYLAKHVLDVLSQEILDHIDQIKEKDVPFARKAELWIARRVELTEKLSPDFIDELYHIDEELEDFVKERTRKNFKHFVDFLSEAQASGDIRADLSPEFIMLVLDRLTDLGRSRNALRLFNDSWPELTRAVNTFFFYGILGSDQE